MIQITLAKAIFRNPDMQEQDPISSKKPMYTSTSWKNVQPAICCVKLNRNTPPTAATYSRISNVFFKNLLESQDHTDLL